MKWIGLDNLILINDECFAPARVLAPESKADFAFILHALSYILVDGHVEIAPLFFLVFLSRWHQAKIHQYLVSNNYVEKVIVLVLNLFYGASITVNVLMFSKYKPDTKNKMKKHTSWRYWIRLRLSENF